MKIGYARVSTKDQNLDLQIDALKKAGCTKIISEKKSGAQARREGLDRVLEILREGDELIVWRLDRLGRTVTNLIEVVNHFEQEKIQFRSLTEDINTGTVSGRFFFHVMSAMAQMERELLKERVQAGLKAAKKQGRIGGRPRAMDDKLLARAVELYTGGKTMQQVADELKVSVPTLYRRIPASERGK